MALTVLFVDGYGSQRLVRFFWFQWSCLAKWIVEFNWLDFFVFIQFFDVIKYWEICFSYRIRSASACLCSFKNSHTNHRIGSNEHRSTGVRHQWLRADHWSCALVELSHVGIKHWSRHSTLHIIDFCFTTIFDGWLTEADVDHTVLSQQIIILFLSVVQILVADSFSRKWLERALERLQFNILQHSELQFEIIRVSKQSLILRITQYRLNLDFLWQWINRVHNWVR